MNFDRIDPATVTAVFLKGDAWHQVRWEHRMPTGWSSTFTVEDADVVFRTPDDDDIYTTVHQVLSVRVTDIDDYRPRKGDYDADLGMVIDRDHRRAS